MLDLQAFMSNLHTSGTDAIGEGESEDPQLHAQTVSRLFRDHNHASSNSCWRVSAYDAVQPFHLEQPLIPG